MPTKPHIAFIRDNLSQGWVEILNPAERSRSFSPRAPEQKSNPKLRKRHIQWMAIGGSVGAGLFLGSGVAIQKAGPALLIAYLVAGAMVYLIQRALAEMTIAHPVAGSFGTYASLYLGPTAGFLVSWTFWLAMSLVGATEMTAAGVLLHHLFPSVAQWIFALGASIFIFLINTFAVRVYGETEYWLALIKVLLIVATMLLSVSILIGHWGPLGATASVSNVWSFGGMLPHGTQGLAIGMIIAVFSFAGTEVIGLAALETEDLEKSIPRAFQGVFFRITFFYLGSVGFLLTMIPWNKFDSSQSPFTQFLSIAGLPEASLVVTLVAVTAMLSSTNTSLYASSRVLSALALAGQAPRGLSGLNRHGVPLLAITISAFGLVVGVVLNYLVPQTAFAFLTNTLAWAIFFVWSSIVLCHLHFYRCRLKAGTLHAVAFRLPGAPWTNAFLLLALTACSCLLALGGNLIPLFAFFGLLGCLAIAHWIITERTRSQN